MSTRSCIPTQAPHLTVSEAAPLLGVSPLTVGKMIRGGRLRAIQYGPGGWYRIREDEIERVLSEGTE